MRRVYKVTPEGMLIKVLMAQNNLTVKELGHRIGKSEATICDVISGKNKSEKTLDLVMNALREGGATANLAECRQFFAIQFGETDNRENPVKMENCAM
ncbi:MAG: helix-turn-helix transcriptional regulator [Clostridiales bacterium]|nr:helix-turn-helix transcriptional regulator [Clostridiales bacterium]